MGIKDTLKEVLIDEIQGMLKCLKQPVLSIKTYKSFNTHELTVKRDDLQNYIEEKLNESK